MDALPRDSVKLLAFFNKTSVIFNVHIRCTILFRFISTVPFGSIALDGTGICVQ